MEGLAEEKAPTPLRLWPPLLCVVAAAFVAVGLWLNGQMDGWQYPLRYEASVRHWAAEYEVDPLLVYAFIHTESDFDPKAESAAGARGLMQMTEMTFDWIKGRMAAEETLTYDDLYDPDVAIRFGTYLLAISLQRYGGDVATVAAAYHNGWGTVDRLLAEETHSGDGVRLNSFPYRRMNYYVYKITRCYEKYTHLYGERMV